MEPMLQNSEPSHNLGQTLKNKKNTERVCIIRILCIEIPILHQKHLKQKIKVKNIWLTKCRAGVMDEVVMEERRERVILTATGVPYTC